MSDYGLPDRRNGAGPTVPGPTGMGTLARVGAALRADAWFVMLPVLATVAGTAWLTSKAPQLYRAEAVVSLPTEELDVPSRGETPGTGETGLRSALLLLRSPEVLDTVARREQTYLREGEEELSPAWASLEAARRYLSERLETDPGRGMNVVELSLTAAAPEQALRLVNEIAHAYERASHGFARQRILRQRDRLEELAHEQDSLLADAHAALGAHRRRGTESVRGSSSDVSGAASRIEEARLVRRLQAMEEVSDRLWAAYQQARVREARDNGGAEVVRLAAAAIPVPRRGYIQLLIGAFIGLLIGGGIVVYRGRGRDRCFSRREEVERELRLPTLAVVPRIGPDTRRWRIRKSGEASTTPRIHGPSRVARRRAGGANVGNGASSRGKNGDRAPDDRPSLDTGDGEAYRMLRTNLLFSGAIGSSRSLVVTSPTPKDGKTVTAANLGIAVARQGIKVLLVEADLRYPQLAAAFGLPREPGLANLLLGEAELQTAIRRTETAGLHLLPAGSTVANPSELLSGRRMARILEDLSERYDLMILDSPPVLSASDATALGAVADGVLMVVRPGGTQRRAARHAIEQLSLVGAHLVGSVLNDPDSRLDDSRLYQRLAYSRDGGSA